MTTARGSAPVAAQGGGAARTARRTLSGRTVLTAVTVAVVVGVLASAVEFEPTRAEVAVPRAPQRATATTPSVGTNESESATHATLRDCSRGAPPCARWRGTVGPAAVTDADAHTIYIAPTAAPTTVAALDRTDGTSRWEVDLATEIVQLGPATASALLVRTVDGALLGLAPQDGRIRWRTTDTRPSTLTVTGPWVQSVEDRRVRALATADGHEIWRWDSEEPVHEVIAGPGAAPLVRQASAVTVLHATTGVPRWTAEVPGLVDVASTPAGEVVAIAASGELAWLAPDDGARRRGSRLAFNAASTVELARAGAELLAVVDPPANDEGITTTRVVGLDADTGAVRWVYLYRSAHERSAVMGLPGRLVLVGTDTPGTVAAVDTATGQMAWQRRLADVPVLAASAPRRLLFVADTELTVLDAVSGAVQAVVAIPGRPTRFVSVDSETAVLDTADGLVAVSLPPAG